MRELVEFCVQLVVVPRLCEDCLQHVAVYYDYCIWPDRYRCRACLLEHQAQMRLYPDLGPCQARGVGP